MYDLEKVKELIVKMNKVGYVTKKELSVEQRLLSPEVSDVAFSLFTEIKSKMPSYTLEGNKELKKYVIGEDGAEEPKPSVTEFFRGNAKALYELIAYAYFGKRKKYKTENHMFHISLFSYYSDKEYDVFFVSKNGKFWLLTDRITDLPLVDYISKYFIDVLPAEVRGEIEILFDDINLEHEVVQEKLNEIAKTLTNKAKEKKYGFQSGAITFMDFLGWKGMWQSRENVDHLERVSGLINEITDKVQEFSCELFPYSDGIELSKLISISDTIAIFTPEIAFCTKLDLLELHARIARYILELCVKATYPIRGAITYGKYNTKNSIMIGPGIDECASWHETCNWIGVHFSPSAELVIRSLNKETSENVTVCNVPIKSGYPKPKYCVRWSVDKEAFMRLTNGVQSLLPEISSKYMNTYEYLFDERGEQ